MEEPHGELFEELNRRGFMQRAGALGLGALVLSAGPLARELLEARPAEAALLPVVGDGPLQAFADTIIPGRPVTRTDLGNPVTPKAIAGVDHRPGAVEADALALYRNAKVGFDALEPAFLVELQSRSLPRGAPFVDLPFDRRVAVCREGLAFSNPDRLLWEAAAAVPFTAFCAAALVPEQTAAKASGYRVMGLPGRAPGGYRHFSYRRRLSRERTRKGNLR